MAKSLSQTQLAAEMNKKQPEYCDYETGKVQLDYEKIVFLCKRLEITPNELFDIDYTDVSCERQIRNDNKQ